MFRKVVTVPPSNTGSLRVAQHKTWDLGKHQLMAHQGAVVLQHCSACAAGGTRHLRRHSAVGSLTARGCCGFGKGPLPRWVSRGLACPWVCSDRPWFTSRSLSQAQHHQAAGLARLQVHTGHSYLELAKAPYLYRSAFSTGQITQKHLMGLPVMP